MKKNEPTEKQREMILEKMFWIALIFLLGGLTYFGKEFGYSAGVGICFFFIYEKEKKVTIK